MRLGFAKVGGLVPRRRSATPYPCGAGTVPLIEVVDQFP
ncbi:hypothetical protein EOJ41_09380 [Vibrio alginolyticus]|nr:hypothetical protein EOJ41_09380 [Vibrio alginolyticus]TMX50096.1 hypothetical protein DA091_21250 [Vibrio alginolyticus]